MIGSLCLNMVSQFPHGKKRCFVVWCHVCDGLDGPGDPVGGRNVSSYVLGVSLIERAPNKKLNRD